MGRKAQNTRKPWTLHKKPNSRNWYVLFSHAGQRHRESTGCADSAAAQAEAARIYAEVVSGRRRKVVAAKKHGGTPALEVLFAEWLASMETTHDASTLKNYEMYVASHFVPFFGSLAGLSTPSCSDYTRMRLRHIQAITLRKEQSALRGFIAWCTEEEQGYFHPDEAPIVRSVPKRVTGTPNARRKEGGWVNLTPKEARAILRHLPVTNPKRNGICRPVRAYFTVLWETGLRPETLCSLRAPHDYKPGKETLTIRDEADKARYGRELPITNAARAALDSVCPDAGYLFPRAPSGKAPDYRETLRRAAHAAGLEADRAGRISAYDFRHGRTTDLASETNDLLGTAYLVGHKNVTTTNKYVHARIDHGRRALQKAEGKRGRR